MVVGGTLSLLFFVSVERERETRRAEGSAWSAPRSVWYKRRMCVLGGGEWRRVCRRWNEARRERAIQSAQRGACACGREYTQHVCGVAVNCVKAVYICCPRCVWPVLCACPWCHCFLKHGRCSRRRCASWPTSRRPTFASRDSITARAVGCSLDGDKIV